jgi:hypothetical protein
MPAFQRLAEHGMAATIRPHILIEILLLREKRQTLAANTRQIHLKVARHAAAGDEDAKATPLDEIRDRRRQ